MCRSTQLFQLYVCNFSCSTASLRLNFSRLKDGNKLFVFLHSSAGRSTSFASSIRLAFYFTIMQCVPVFVFYPSTNSTTFRVHVILTQWQKRARNTAFQLCTTTLRNSIRNDNTKGVVFGVSRCTLRPAQAVTLSAIWCNGQVQTATNNPITSFWFSTLSFSHSPCDVAAT
jgi:hypothetical protein